KYRHRLRRPARAAENPGEQSLGGAHQPLRLCGHPRRPGQGRDQKAAQHLCLHGIRNGTSGGAGAPGHRRAQPGSGPFRQTVRRPEQRGLPTADCDPAGPYHQAGEYRALALAGRGCRHLGQPRDAAPRRGRFRAATQNPAPRDHRRRRAGFTRRKIQPHPQGGKRPRIAVRPVTEPNTRMPPGRHPSIKDSETRSGEIMKRNLATRLGFILLAAVTFAPAAFAGGETFPAEGVWRGEFRVNGEPLPFNFEITGNRAEESSFALINGSRRDYFNVEQRDDGTLWVVMNTYDAALEARIEEGSGGKRLVGHYRDLVPKRNGSSDLPFTAEHGQNWRFVEPGKDRGADADLD